MMWNGTREQIYQLYEVASKHLKACFPHLKLGGYASCGFYGILAENPSAWEYGTAPHSAKIAAMMLAMQNRHTDLLCIYDMRTNTAPYCPLFDIRTHKPIHGYYSLVAFNALYKLGSQVALDCDTPELYAVAASDGTHHALLISNLTGEAQALNISGVDLKIARFHVIDQERLLSWSPALSRIEKDEVLLIEWQ